ncbi:MAG: hypothetical protein LBL96_08775 [Clostridiales bacterium]|jgi:hypothetical protein|nr:hypothetical protein [Clostridiales bacterium]
MKEAVAAYKSVTVSSEFRELERLRERTRHNEASALGNAPCIKVRPRARQRNVKNGRA